MAFEKGLEAVLKAAAIGGSQEGTSGCMGLGAISEFDQSDREIASLIDTTARTLLSAVQHRIEDGKSRGEISARVDTLAGAEFITVMLSVIKLAARGGASPQTLRNIAQMAIRSLK